VPASFTVTITVRRPGGWTTHGDPLPAGEHEEPGCIVAPTSGDSGSAGSNEYVDLRDTVITGRVIYAPIGADIQATDEIVIPGETGVWQVDGDAGAWRSPFSNWQPGQQLVVRRVRG
jgi:hypothetical protein